jgi:hypothetical protein
MGKETEYSYSDLYDKVQNSQVLDASIQGNDLQRPPEGLAQRRVPHHSAGQLRRPAEGDARTSKVNFSIKEPQTTTS